MSTQPVIIVTGANSGIGFGICQRLLAQLSSKNSDATSNEVELPCDGLTLILACRSKQRAEAAQKELYAFADEQLHRCKESPNYDGHAEVFRKNLHIVIHTIDLADIASVFHFADEVAQTYPYVSHLICNAGVASFASLDWPVIFWQFAREPVMAVTKPLYYIQRVGEMSTDGLGWVWQCNVFGHYALFRALEPVMAKCTTPTGPRVLWTSSHEASPQFYDPKDWQLVKSAHSYESSKYQVNMISLHLNRRALRDRVDDKPVIRHFTSLPGVVGTNIAHALLGTFTSWIMFATFYFARLFGSPYHPIWSFKAAVSSVYLAFASLVSLPDGVIATTNNEPVDVSTLYVSEASRWGQERVGTMKLVQTRAEETQTDELLANCDRLLQTLCDVHGRKSPSG